MTYTLTDLFCGAGGSMQGAVAVPGVRGVIAANHWQMAIETHAANFPDLAHDCADISQVRPQRYPYTDILWASPECTNHSQAKGAKRATLQSDLFGDTLPDEAAERSRATMWDVPRFCETHRYRAVIVENVVDAARWVMWPAWLQAMELLGYRHRTVWLNSMHAPAQAAPRAPQSRDRLYVVFWRAGDRAPDVEPRPLAWCDTCEQDVRAVQSWKRPDVRWGRYRSQYVYRCPRQECRHAVVEPYADPAASAIDWTLAGQRIGDRDKPLSAKTLARIRAGLERYARPLTFEARGNTYVRTGADGRPRYARAWPVDQPTATLHTTESRALVVPSGGTWNETATTVGEPLRTRTSRETDALVVPVEGREHVDARPASIPARTQTARLQDALVVPYYGSTTAAQGADEPLPTQPTRDRFGVAFVAELRGGGSDARDVREPLATVTASGNHHMLVRNNSSRGDGGEMCTPATEPARTITTKGHQSIVGWPDQLPEVEDCTFRMLEPREIQAAMAFERTYRVLGNRREQVRQLGNGVTPPAAEFLIRAVVAALEGEEAA